MANPTFTEEGFTQYVTFELAYTRIGEAVTAGGPNPNQQKLLLKRLQKALHITDQQFKVIQEKNLTSSPEESALSRMRDIEERLYTCLLDKHPYYKQNSFTSPEGYEIWKQTEKSQVLSLMRDQLSRFGKAGKVKVKIIEAKNLKHTFVTKYETYCTVSVVESYVTNPIKMSVNPTWNQTFTFDIPMCPITMQIKVVDVENNKEQVLGDFNITITLDDLLQQKTHPATWYKLGANRAAPKGELCIELAYSSLFAKYHKIIKGDITPIEPRNIINYHDKYEVLVKMLFLYDKFDDNAKNLLSSDTQWLFTEFASYYGIGAAYESLIVVENLDREFEPLPGYLEPLSKLLGPLLTFSTEHMTKYEAELSSKTFTHLAAIIEKTVGKYKECFPGGKPAGALTSAINILSMLTKRNCEKKLSECVEKQATKTFNTLRDKAGGFTDVTRCIALVDGIVEELEDEFSFYLPSFPASFPFMVQTSSCYQKLLVDEIRSFCENHTKLSDWPDLYLRVRDFPSKIEPLLGANAKLKPIELQEIFSGYVFDWLRDSIPKLEGMVTEALKHDKKVPLSDTVMHSSSVTDVFVALNQAFTFIIISTVAKTYVKSLESDAMEQVKPYLKVEKSMLQQSMSMSISMVNALLPGKDNPGTPTTEKKDPLEDIVTSIPFCVIINNIETARTNLDSVISKIEAELSSPRSPPPSPYGKTTQPQTQPQTLQPLSSSQRSTLMSSLPATPSPALPKAVSMASMSHLNAQPQDNHNNMAGVLHTTAPATPTQLAGSGEFAPQTPEQQTLDCVRDTVRTTSQDAFQYMKKSVQNLLSVVDTGLNRTLKSKFLAVTEGKPDDVVWGELSNYLDGQLDKLSQGLLPNLFRRVLANLWASTVLDAKEILLGKTKVQVPSVQAAANFAALFENVRQYLHADGKGVSQAAIDDDSVVVKALLELYRSPTAKLIAQAVAIANNNNTPTPTPTPTTATAPATTTATATPTPTPGAAATATPAPVSLGHPDIGYEQLMTILSARKADKEAQTFVKDKAGHSSILGIGWNSINQHEIRDAFSLPSSEVVIDSFNCSFGNSTGHLYVCSSHVCFGTSLGFTDRKIVVPFSEIATLAKEKTLFVMDTGLKVVTKGKQEYVFSNLLKRNKALQEIVEQAAKLNIHF